MSEHGSFSAGARFGPAEALDSAAVVDARARRRARWPAWVWIGLGIVMPTHLLGSQLGDQTWVEDVVVWLVPGHGARRCGLLGPVARGESADQPVDLAD